MEVTDNEISASGLIEFLKTDIPQDELKVALKVLLAFKECESGEEWLYAPFATWMRLEQYEDYLKLLTDTNAEAVTDAKAKAYLAQLRQQPPA